MAAVGGGGVCVVWWQSVDAWRESLVSLLLAVAVGDKGGLSHWWWCGSPPKNILEDSPRAVGEIGLPRKMASGQRLHGSLPAL